MKHHYIPVFYLKCWCQDGKLAEYSRPHFPVIARSKAPAATGYMVDLNKRPGVPADQSHELETGFLKVTDDLAANALKLLRSGSLSLSVEFRSAWTRFVISLIRRSPEEVERLKVSVKPFATQFATDWQSKYEQLRLPHHPATLSELFSGYQKDYWDNVALDVLMQVIDSKMVGDVINGMCWGICSLEKLPHSILTSGRPVIMTDGLMGESAHIVVPIGPSSIFVAAKNVNVLNQIKNIPAHELCYKINDTVCRQAVQYVYGADERQLRFVENRLRKKHRP